MFQWNNNFSFFCASFICIIILLINTNIISISYNTCLIFKRFRISRKRITWFISIVIPQASCCFFIIFAVFKQIIHRHYDIQVLCIVNFCAIDFRNTVYEWSIIFKCYCFIFLFFILFYFIFCIVWISNSNISFHNNIRIAKITQI